MWAGLVVFCMLQGIVRQLRESDAQLFAGWGGHVGINDVAVLRKLHNISQTAIRLLKVTCSYIS